MPRVEVPAAVKREAGIMAEEWLLEQGYCPCGTQVRQVARAFQPAAHMFWRELTYGNPATLKEVREKLQIFARDVETDLARGLHRPGASAALDDDRRDRNGVDRYC